MLLGLIFADPALRRIFSRPISSDDRYTWLVWNNNDRVYGFAALKLDRPGGGAELCHAYTDPAWRGNGFHSYSVSRRIVLAQEAGASYVYTVLRPEGEVYYAERGFIRTRQRGQYLIMSKDLRTPDDGPAHPESD